MEHVTKCRNSSRVALSSIFHPLESPKMQRARVRAVRGSGPGVPPLCSQSLCSFLSTKGLEMCVCGCGAPRGRDALVWQCPPWRAAPGAVAVCDHPARGLVLWDPLTDLSHCCGWRRALSWAGVSPRNPCRAVKAPGWGSSRRGCERSHLQPALEPLLSRSPGDVSAHLAVPAGHSSVPGSSLGCLNDCPETGEKWGKTK